MTTDWIHAPVREINPDWLVSARQKQKQLTKPEGSLGRLEDIAVKISALHGCARPGLDKIQIVIFAADHGVAAEGVSAFPASVTLAMIRNFAGGGAAISVMAQELGADLEVVNLGTLEDQEDLLGVIREPIAPGTANFSREPAMTEAQLAAALEAGRQAARRARGANVDLFIGGDMGIGNTTSATALACALLQQPAEALTGPGTGVSGEQLQHKVQVIQQGLDLHRDHLTSPLAVLQHLGGFEIAALTGAYLGCAQQGLPILVDGFITSVAAQLAVAINPAVKRWMFFSHTSAEPGHRQVLEAMQAQPLLDLGMRLGEASGAAAAVPLMRMACACHNRMASFAQAGVAEKNA